MLPVLAVGGDGIVFDGTDDYIGISGLGNIVTCSIVLWVKIATDARAYEYLLDARVDGGAGYIYWQNSDNVLTSSGGTKYIDGTEGNILNEDGWHCVVASGTTINAVTDLKLGTRLNVADSLLGSIGEVLIYNVVLTADEISAIYASKGAWYPRTGLLSRWSMDNNGISTGQAHPNGSTIKDSVGSNDGTIVDGADSSMVLVTAPTRTKRGRR